MMRMAIHDPLGVWLVMSLIVGLAAHVAIVLWHRCGYGRLRSAYAGAVAAAQETGSADALVRAEELHREFMRADSPNWLIGIGAHVKAGFVIGGIVSIGMMNSAGHIRPAFAALAILFALGLRRLLLGSALLLVALVVSSLLSSLQSTAQPPEVLSAPPHAAKALTRP